MYVVKILASCFLLYLYVSYSQAGAIRDELDISDENDSYRKIKEDCKDVFEKKKPGQRRSYCVYHFVTYDTAEYASYLCAEDEIRKIPYTGTCGSMSAETGRFQMVFCAENVYVCDRHGAIPPDPSDNVIASVNEKSEIKD